MAKKKILFLTNHFQYSDGTASALIGLVNNLNPEKFDITVKPLFRCDKKRASELNSNIKLEKCFGFYFRGFNRLVKKLFSPVVLYKRFVDSKYDIEVAFQRDLPTIIVGASKNERAVHVEWMHGYDLWPEQYIKADQVVCVSKHNEERTRREMNGNVNVTCCYNLMDDKLNCEKAKENVSNLDFSELDNPVFVTVGRMSPEKGYVRLVKICKDLFNKGYNFTLLIVGGGEGEIELRSLIDELGVGNRVIMTGAQNNPHKYTAHADCFICSSFSEGYSTACTEAAILGVPVITTNVPGGKEIIETCGCGLLTETDDESLKSGMEQVLNKPKLLKEWKTVMAETKRHFSLEERKDSMNDLFDTFIEMSNNKLKEYRL